MGSSSFPNCSSDTDHYSGRHRRIASEEEGNAIGLSSGRPRTPDTNKEPRIFTRHQ